MIWYDGTKTVHESYADYNKAVMKRIELEQQGFEVYFTILPC